MPRLQWQLRHGRPGVEVILTLAMDAKPFPRFLLADTGAGSQRGHIDVILDEEDCLLCGGIPLRAVTLAGAYIGSFPTYGISVRLPDLGFDQNLRAVGVPSVPAGFDGIACFSFLNRLTYGNFGDRDQFGLESD
jgi:hypothetical protein